MTTGIAQARHKRATSDQFAGGFAHVGGYLATDLLEVSNDPAVLDRSGRWVVIVDFEGAVLCARFANWEKEPPPPAIEWKGPPHSAWTTSIQRDDYLQAVSNVRELIAAGIVYQVNVCRIMSATLGHTTSAEATASLLRHITAHHSAPFAGAVAIRDHRHVVTASPELFLRRQGRTITSSPIKGTGRTQQDLQEKDRAENVMIVDLVRNDLSRVCEPGSVVVDKLLAVEKHPGLVHLVSTVSGELQSSYGWPELLGTAFPPGSVTGAPKSTALEVIKEFEPVPRGPYCGAIGWVDADTCEAELAVGIRTFWFEDDKLHFGTGAGITWGSDPHDEWRETELKAERLVGLASC